MLLLEDYFISLNFFLITFSFRLNQISKLNEISFNISFLISSHQVVGASKVKVSNYWGPLTPGSTVLNELTLYISLVSLNPIFLCVLK